MSSALDALESALNSEREALLGHDVEALVRSTQAKLSAIRAVETAPPAGDLADRFNKLLELNRSNGTLLARRRRAVHWALRQMGRQEAGGYDARGHVSHTLNRRALAVA